MDERRLNRRLTDTGMTNPIVHNRPLKGRFNMGISWRNGARPRLTLEILWTTSNVRRILGGPGRNRPGPRMKPPFLLEYVADSLGPKRQL